MNQWIKALFLGILMIGCDGTAREVQEQIEILSLDILSYEDFVANDPTALQVLNSALQDKGIVGIKGIPGYREKVRAFVCKAQEFAALPEEVKMSYAPDLAHRGMLGYEMGKEKFKRPDGSWIVDHLKVSYYGHVPDDSRNRWPEEVDLKTPFQNLGALMAEVGEAVMEKIGLVGAETGIYLDGVPRVGRMLHYRNDSALENPFWCGAHFDHGLFTALTPASYFLDGNAIDEPLDAGLYVKTHKEGVFKKVVADDPEVLLFQVGEFGQLSKNDAIRATEHRVQKAPGCMERFAMALFFSPSPTTTINSHSELTLDARYGTSPDHTCSFQQWHEGSINRYRVEGP